MFKKKRKLQCLCVNCGRRSAFSVIGLTIMQKKNVQSQNLKSKPRSYLNCNYLILSQKYDDTKIVICVYCGVHMVTVESLQVIVASPYPKLLPQKDD